MKKKLALAFLVTFSVSAENSLHPVSEAVFKNMVKVYRFDHLYSEIHSSHDRCNWTTGVFEAEGLESPHFYDVRKNLPENLAQELGVLSAERHLFEDSYSEPTDYHNWVNYVTNPVGKNCSNMGMPLFGTMLSHAKAYDWNRSATFLTQDTDGNPTIVYATYTSGKSRFFKVRFIWNRN